jgi:hypothetical protein
MTVSSFIIITIPPSLTVGFLISYTADDTPRLYDTPKPIAAIA